MRQANRFKLSEISISEDALSSTLAKILNRLVLDRGAKHGVDQFKDLCRLQQLCFSGDFRPL